MMRLIDVHEFLDTYYSQRSRPSARTVRTWCEKRQLPARHIGGKWFIDQEAFEADEDQELIDKVLHG